MLLSYMLNFVQLDWSIVVVGERNGILQET